jgi:hypothetical protein
VCSETETDGTTLEQVKKVNYLGCELSLGGEPNFDQKKPIPKNIGTVRKHLNKIRTDTQMKFYKVVARSTLLYGSETWVTTKRDMTRLEAAEMRCLGIHKTGQNKKRNYKESSRDLWNKRREIQTQTKLDQPT